MSTEDIDTLAQRGNLFRSEVFCDDFLHVAGQHLTSMPDAAIGQYSLTEQYHVTHDAQIAAIRAEGLRPNVELFERSDEVFFAEQFEAQQRRRPDYTDQSVVNRYIFGRQNNGTFRGMYTTANTALWHVERFAVPHRTRLFMRNLHHLSHLGEVDVGVQEQASALVEKYAGRLALDGQVMAGVFMVDPKSSLLARAILGRCDLGDVEDDVAVQIVRGMQKEWNLELQGHVAAKHLNLTAKHTFDGANILSHIINRDAQVVFKPSHN